MRRVLLHKISINITNGVLFILSALLLSTCAPFMGPGIDLEPSADTDYLKRKAPSDGVDLALVLSGGASRGLAHLGVIKAIEEENVPVDLIIGTSIGAIIGAMYASGMSIKEMETFVRQAMDKSLRLLNLAMFSREKFGLLDFTPFQKVLTEHLPFKRIEQFPIKFAAVATDLNTGSQVVFSEGPAIIALSASSAVPGIFSPVFHNDHWLVDGGLVNNLPADVARKWNADVVIAVNTMKNPKNFNPKGYLDILTGSLHVIISKTGKANESYADIVIEPLAGDMRGYEFSAENLDILMEAGKAALKEKLPLIRQKLSQSKEILKASKLD